MLTCAVVEIRFARKKSILVVTAIWPRRLNLVAAVRGIFKECTVC